MPGRSNTEPFSDSIQEPNQGASKLANESDEVKQPGVSRMDAILQWLMVMIVLAAAVYLAIINNQQEVIFNLATLCFGYYFGKRDTTVINTRK